MPRSRNLFVLELNWHSCRSEHNGSRVRGWMIGWLKWLWAVTFFFDFEIKHSNLGISQIQEVLYCYYIVLTWDLQSNVTIQIRSRCVALLYRIGSVLSVSVGATPVGPSNWGLQIYFAGPISKYGGSKLLPNSSRDIYWDLYFEVDPICHPKIPITPVHLLAVRRPDSFLSVPSPQLRHGTLAGSPHPSHHSPPPESSDAVHGRRRRRCRTWRWRGRAVNLHERAILAQMQAVARPPRADQPSELVDPTDCIITFNRCAGYLRPESWLRS
jgi:hypothetical protein